MNIGMKKLLQYILLFILLSFSAVILANRESVRKIVQETTELSKPCSKPIEYSIGEVDPQFGISKDQLIQDSEKAEKVWEDAAGKNLFEYNPNAKLKINLIFDERQQESNEATILENNLKKLDLAHESTLENYNSLSSDYKSKLQVYNADVAKYKKKLSDYNDEVKKINSQGGASPDEYDQLEKERKDLEKTFNDLEKERDKLNALAQKTNQAAKEENAIVNQYNTGVETYRDKFGGSIEFEKGVFDGENINIYQFREDSDLEMTLIHEMGHALGMGHVDNPKSIMYYLMGDQDLDNPKPTEEDLSALKSVCEIN
jgi:uncharacterized phage infection (PIP) family protein YhgE